LLEGASIVPASGALGKLKANSNQSKRRNPAMKPALRRWQKLMSCALSERLLKGAQRRQ
jgi:hypothetical protein